jgi:N utilization substance protein B
MLNRRILRSKALQQAYAYQSCKNANFQLALEALLEKYEPDLNSLEIQDKAELKAKQAQARDLFVKQHFKTSDKEMLANLNEARDGYKELNRRDLQQIKKQLVSNAEKIYDLYLAAMLLLQKVADLVNQKAIETAKNRPMAPPPDENELKFYNNPVIRLIRDSKEFNKECSRRKISWNDDLELIDNLYKEGLRKNEDYKKYLKADLSGLKFADHLEIVQKVFADVILNHALAQAEFENRDISWFQNKSIVRSMVKFTFKSIDDDTSELPFAPLAKNWDDDKSFYEKLFNFTIENDAAYDELIASKTKNWDKERISMMDKIIMKMALCELENFPSIPVKVTINEFIDLSKQYSTPKSKNFVNGVLDKLAEELKANGRIKKSGRGLIDNK